MSVEFEGVVPILSVRDLSASVDYYTRILSFDLQWQADGGIASVARGRCSIFLVEGDQGHAGTWIWIGVSDAHALYEQYRANGAKIRHPPTNYPWACEMQVEDPDGHVLRMGSDPKENVEPGEWLDMRGIRWRRRNDGGWSRVEE